MNEHNFEEVTYKLKKNLLKFVSIRKKAICNKEVTKVHAAVLKMSLRCNHFQ